MLTDTLYLFMSGVDPVYSVHSRRPVHRCPSQHRRPLVWWRHSAGCAHDHQQLYCRICCLETCISDAAAWMSANKQKLIRHSLHVSTCAFNLLSWCFLLGMWWFNCDVHLQSSTHLPSSSCSDENMATSPTSCDTLHRPKESFMNYAQLFVTVSTSLHHLTLCTCRE